MIEFPAASTLDHRGEAEQGVSVARLVHDDVDTGQAAGVGVFAGGLVGALVGLVAWSSSPEPGGSGLGWGLATVFVIVLLFATLLVLNTYFRRVSRKMVGLVMAYEARLVELALKAAEQAVPTDPGISSARSGWRALVAWRRNQTVSAGASAGRRRGG